MFRDDQLKHIHLIGICGTAMASLAGMLHDRGFTVTGSDQNIYPPMSNFLEQMGISLFKGFSEDHLDPEPDMVIIGNAISRGNRELEVVLNRKIYYTSMPEVLKELFIRGKRSIVVAGTHGKTTTTSLLAWIFEFAGFHPSFLIGGIAENFGSSYKLGDGEVFIIEGDEYDTAFFDKGPKFLHYLPETVVFNNCEFDHVDIYPDFEAVKLSFRRLINIIPSEGRLIAGWDDQAVRELSERALCPVDSFGFERDSQWRADSIETLETVTHFRLWKDQSECGVIDIPLSGNFNVKNVVAAIACANHYGIGLETIRLSLRKFKNVKRRLELRGNVKGIILLDDFAHHPTAIQETLGAVKARYPGSRIWAIFEPRSATSRRNVFQNEFSESFDVAERVIIASVYAAEKLEPSARLDVNHLVATLNKRGVQAEKWDSADEIVQAISPRLKGGDVLVVMSNGGFDGIHEKILRTLQDG